MPDVQTHLHRPRRFYQTQGHLSEAGRKGPAKKSKARLGPAKHVCTLCGSTFARAFHLTRHLQSVHTNKELMICTTCRKIYNRKKAFEIHKAQCSNLSQERVVQGGSPSEHIAPPNNHPESEPVSRSRSQPTVLQPLSMVTSTSTGRMTVEDMDTLDDILNEITC